MVGGRLTLKEEIKYAQKADIWFTLWYEWARESLKIVILSCKEKIPINNRDSI